MVTPLRTTDMPFTRPSPTGTTAVCSISIVRTDAGLEALESHGVITKKTYAEVPPRTEYTRTTKGRDLVPILQTMAAWGDKYHEQC